MLSGLGASIEHWFLRPDECDDKVDTYAEKWALIWLCSVACCDEMKQSCFAVNILESEDGSECENLATLEYLPFKARWKPPSSVSTTGPGRL